MNRCAILSDIHANLPALEAVLADVEERAIESTYHLGDLIGYGPWPNEVVARLRQAGIPGVQGNYDSTVAHGHPHCGCQYDDPEEQALSQISYSWTVERVGPEERRFLASLPFRLEVRPAGGHRGRGARVILIHGGAHLNTVYWREDRSEGFSRKMIRKLGANPGDVVVFGHTHRPWIRRLDDVLLVNAGSVGRPKDGDPRAAWLDIAFEPDLSVEIRRVPYSVESTVRAIAKAGLPQAFGTILETGGHLRAT